MSEQNSYEMIEPSLIPPFPIFLALLKRECQYYKTRISKMQKGILGYCRIYDEDCRVSGNVVEIREEV